MMLVNELSSALNVSPDTIRHYTRIGLLDPIKSDINGYNYYRQKDEATLRFVLRAKMLGFSLSDIQEILFLADSGNCPCPLVRARMRRNLESTKAALTESQLLFDRMDKALHEWDEKPDTEPDSGAICDLIESWGEDVSA